MNDAIQKELNNDGVLKLSLNRPEVLNAMNADLIMGLLDALYEAKSDKKVRSIIITGNLFFILYKYNYFFFRPLRWPMI